MKKNLVDLAITYLVTVFLFFCAQYVLYDLWKSNAWTFRVMFAVFILSINTLFAELREKIPSAVIRMIYTLSAVFVSLAILRFAQ
jgi:hypothetical protein